MKSLPAVFPFVFFYIRKPEFKKLVLLHHNIQEPTVAQSWFNFKNVILNTTICFSFLLLRFLVRGFTAPGSSRLVDSRWVSRFLRRRAPSRVLRVPCPRPWLVRFPRHRLGSPTALAPCQGAARFPESASPARRVQAPSWNDEM